MKKYKVMYQKKVYGIIKKVEGGVEVEARSRKHAIKLVENRDVYFKWDADFKKGETETVKAFSIKDGKFIHNI